MLPDISIAEAEANARLIAAAPALLAACKMAHAMASEYDGNGSCLDAINAALAKAEGKQHEPSPAQVLDLDDFDARR